QRPHVTPIPTGKPSTQAACRCYLLAARSPPADCCLCRQQGCKQPCSYYTSRRQQLLPFLALR
ncbi:unnamed protein product, partial [Musa textilis]